MRYESVVPLLPTDYSHVGTREGNLASRQRILFISHSSYDKPYVSCLVDLLRKQGLSKDKVFCSSYPGYGVPGGRDIFDFLRSRLVDYDPYVLFVISRENYYASPACLNEMGAAWVLGSKSNAILLPGTTLSDLRGAIGSDFLSVVLDDDDAKYRLTELRDDVLGFLGAEIDPSSSWEYDRDKFLSECGDVATTKRPSYLPGVNLGDYLDDLIEGRVSVTHSLRRALGVARREGDKESAAWISAELTGYGEDDDLPAYRQVSSSNMRYSGIVGMLEVGNVMLPLHYLDQESLDAVVKTNVVDAMESVVKMAEANREITRNLSALIPVIYHQTDGDCQCTSVVQVLPQSAMQKIVSSVEDRLMSFFAARMG